MWQLPSITALGMTTRDEKSLHSADQADLILITMLSKDVGIGI